MSKQSKARAKARKAQHRQPSAPRVIGANDNHLPGANDNEGPVVIGGITLSSDLAKAFREAEVKQASASLEDRREGFLAMSQIEQALAVRLDAKEMKAVRAEIDALEKTRGNALTVGKLRDHRGIEGDVWKVSRDGLETLHTAKSLSETQYSAGLRFRADYELLDPERGLTPPALDQTRNIVRGGEGFAAKRAERELHVRDLEMMIQAEDRTFRGALGRSDVERVGRAVWALREIAGKGSNLVALSSSGSVQARTSEALRVALDCAAIAYGLE